MTPPQKSLKKKKKMVEVSPTDNVDFSLLAQLLQAFDSPSDLFFSASFIV